MKHLDAAAHTRGESIYLDDIPLIQGTLFAAAFGSPVAHGLVRSLDTSLAEACPGVVRIFTYKDVTGENQVGGIIPDEPLFAEQHVHFVGMPLALIVASTDEAARRALDKIKVDIETRPVITDPREAQALGELIVPPRTFQLGNTGETWAQCVHIVEGRADTNGQEHLYIETQGAYAVPLDGGMMRIYSSTQAPTAVQRAVSKVTGLAMHALDIEVTRLGGGFGGKEDQANIWAALVALASCQLKKAGKIRPAPHG